MRTATRIIALSLALVTGVLASETAFARRGHHHRGHIHFGFAFGAPLFAPYYYSPYYYSPPPYYYYPPVVAAPPSPPVYIEQSTGPQVAPAPQLQHWYYCDESKSYYPYVKACPGGWRQVAPQPAS